MTELFPKDTVFTVSNLTSLIREILEGTFSNITLEGEISNYRPNSSGHLYFTLKDEGAQISAVMFRGRAMSLDFVPKDGMKVKCTGSISVYAPRGNYQIIINKMEIAGAGNILQILEERKRKLAEEGLFNSERKKPIPRFSKRVGIVTSPTGAALRDILQITKRRNPGVDVVILPALVQGEGAAVTIANMIKTANDFDMCDVLIVGRGGGSLEDLLPFSEEVVVRAIAGSHIPVVSAVGHEIDWALSDYAADMRAPTPSAAAELVVPKQSDILQGLAAYKEEFYNQITGKVERLKLMIKSFDVGNMEVRFRSIEQPLLNRLENARQAMIDGMNQKIKETRQIIQQSVHILEQASPQTILNRGYSMVRTEDGKIVRSPLDASAGTRLEITPANGKIYARVE
ncbi:exodeoxyribonuclease VII large subunit [Treponema ruminis]|uniref:Exodeoxyribonuclease 7 large subunit n=1 Tax=Treponema ruminis TaxID=744515 RepID=A0A7W8G873_9SPIR|nr:exodeoxyribonuclease VII large subunit [Treponema ruminis]MBB5225630.1 exodeoxyribonuclease VII large subunit [Treponema ruminis]QSI02319.1 exodeoxyribonuclease VII large subunit [Treponema ruminis]